YPGGSNRLDDLCVRLGIDNSRRTKHGALLDAELLAEVYIELVDARQAQLALVAMPASPIIVRDRAVSTKVRPVPLRPRITDANVSPTAPSSPNLAPRPFGTTTPRRSRSPLGDLHRDCAEEVAFGEIYAAMTEDCVSRSEMKVEVRQREKVEVVGACHVAFVSRTERKRDVAVRGLIDVLSIDRFQIGYRFRQTVFQLIDGGFVVLIARGFDTCQA